MDAIDSELQAAGGPFFLGSELSLVDITFVPMLERAAASLAYYKGCYVRGEGRWPAVDRWFDALEARSTYMGTKWVGGRVLGVPVWLHAGQQVVHANVHECYHSTHCTCPIPVRLLHVTNWCLKLCSWCMTTLHTVLSWCPAACLAHARLTPGAPAAGPGPTTTPTATTCHHSWAAAPWCQMACQWPR
jgi:hypothetical protein